MDIGATIDLATQPLIEQIESQQQEIEQLKEENRTLAMSFITCKSKAKYYEEENKALLGVIKGMKLIIQELENGRNKII